MDVTFVFVCGLSGCGFTFKAVSASIFMTVSAPLLATNLEILTLPAIICFCLEGKHAWWISRSWSPTEEEMI